jgi:hypothetical protein
MSAIQSFNSAIQAAEDAISGQTQSDSPGRSATPSPGSSSESSSGGMASVFKSVRGVEGTNLGSASSKPRLAVDSALSSLQPTSSSVRSQQRPSVKQKRWHSTDLDTRAQTYPADCSTQTMSGDTATYLASPKPEQVAVCDVHEQNLDEARKEASQGGRPLLRRRLGFLR